MATRSWRGVGLVSVWQTTASLCFYAIFAATAAVRETFTVSRTLVGVAVTAVMVGYTAFLFLTGAAVDSYGERPVMVGGLFALGAGTVGIGIAPTYLLLLLALVAVGGVYATAMPATNRAVLAVAPTGRRNLAMNVKQVGVTAGSGLSALVVTAAATTAFGWRAGFLTIGVVSVAVGLAFAWGYPGGDGGGGSLSLPSMGPLWSMSDYRALVVAGFFLGAAVFTTTGYVVLHLTESVGTPATVAGLTLALVQITGSVSRIVSGAVADRLPGPAELATARVLLVQAVCAAAAFVAVTVAADPLPAVVAFAVLGLFILGFPGIYYGVMTALVPEEQVGAATAGGQTALNAGGLLAPPAFGYLADTVTYDAGWLALAGCSVVAAVVVGSIAFGD